MYKNEYTMNDKLIAEYVYSILCKNIIIAGAAIAILGFAMFTLIDGEMEYVMLFASCIALLCMAFGPLIMIKQLKDTSKRLNNGKIEKTIVEFNENIVMNEGKAHLEFEYNQIKKIKQTRHFIILMISNKSAILVLKDGFINGNRDKFIEFINKMVKR